MAWVKIATTLWNGMTEELMTNAAFEAHDAKARANNFRFERWNFRLIHGYRLDLDNPRSFNEKIVWKKIFDRNPLLPVVADKYRVREYLVSKLGKKSAEAILVPLIWAGDDPENIPFADLPADYALKANHGSRMNLIVNADHQPSVESMIQTCNQWLKKDFGVRRNEWCYQPIPRKIVIEEYLQNQSGKIPSDVKLYMFNGKLGLVEIIADRFHNRSATYFDENLERVEMSNGGKPSNANPLPQSIEEMISVAQALSSDFDHIRVDLYDLDGTVKFGELTNYNASGRVAIKPRSEDFRLGEKWSLDRTYARKI